MKKSFIQSFFILSVFDIFFVVLDKGPIYQHISTGCGIVATEIPIAQMVGASLVQPFEALEHQFHLGIQVRGTQYLGYFLGNLVGGEWGVYGFGTVFHFGKGLFEFLDACHVRFVHYVHHAAFLQQIQRCEECHEVVEFFHIYTVVVGIAYLRARRNYDYFLGFQPVEYAQYALAQGGSTYYTVVYDHKVIDLGLY